MMMISVLTIKSWALEDNIMTYLILEEKVVIALCLFTSNNIFEK